MKIKQIDGAPPPQLSGNVWYKTFIVEEYSLPPGQHTFTIDVDFIANKKEEPKEDDSSGSAPKSLGGKALYYAGDFASGVVKEGVKDILSASPSESNIPWENDNVQLTATLVPNTVYLINTKEVALKKLSLWIQKKSGEKASDVIIVEPKK